MPEWDDRLGVSMIRWIALLPLVSAVVHGALIGLVRAQISDRSVWSISLTALATSFGLSLLSIFDLVGSGRGEPILDSVGPWIGGGVGPRSFSAELTFQLDPLSAVFCLAATGIALTVYCFSIGLLRSGGLERDSGHRTFAMLDLLVGSTLVLVLADNLLLFFLGWAGVGIASQLFASFDFEGPNASRAGAITFVVGRVGDLGLLGAVLLLFDGLSRADAPALSFRGIEAAFRLLEGQGIDWLARGTASAPPLLEAVGFGLVLAALTKCAQLPLHFWLPRATDAPIPASALMQSATTTIAGIYVLLRFSFLLDSTPGAMQLLVVAGAATMFAASLAAATQLDLSRLVAFTTSSVLGLALLGLGRGAWSSAAFLLLGHAFVKAHLILALGLVTVALSGETDLRRMGGLAQHMRWTQAMVGLGCLAVAAIPPFATFFPTEELLAHIAGSDRAGSGALVALILASTGILAFAMGRGFFLIFWGNVRHGGQAQQLLQDPTGLRQHSLTVLAVVVVVAGLLSPSQYWGDLELLSVPESDSIGHFLSGRLLGSPDPGVGNPLRVQLVAALVASSLAGLGLAAWRYSQRGYRGEPKLAFARAGMLAMREMFFVEQLLDAALVRPIRWISRIALVGGIETRLIDRVVVSGGSGLVRRFAWDVLRRIQNGRLQSYALLGLLSVLVAVTWMVVGLPGG